MAANPNVGPEGGSGAGGTPSEPVSPQPQAPIEGDVHQLLTAFGEEIKGLRSELRGLQGRQDRSDSQYSDFQKQLARLNQYKAQGLSDEEALDEMQYDDLAEQRWTNLDKRLSDLASLVQSGGTQTNAQQWVATALNEYGLDPRDPFVAGKLAGQNIATKEQAELLAGRILRDKQLAPQTNPAQQSATPGGATSQNNQEAMVSKLKELQMHPVENRKEIADLKKQLGW